MNQHMRNIDRITEALTSEIPINHHSDAELVSMLAMYSSLQSIHKRVDSKEPISSYLLDEIQVIYRNNAELSGLLKEPERLISNHHEVFDYYVSLLRDALHQYQPETTFSTWVESTRLCQEVIRETHLTPQNICKLTQLILPEERSGQMLDMNARFNDWFNSMPDRRLPSITSLCFHPIHYLVNTLQANLEHTGLKEIYLEKPYQVDIEHLQSKYDFIFSNPPYGKLQPSIYKTQEGSVAAEFLEKALSLSSNHGKLAFVVPRGFLFKSNPRSKEYQVRKAITDSNTIKAIIELPEQAFLPYAKVESALLLIDLASSSDEVCFIKLSKTGYTNCHTLISDLTKSIWQGQEAPKDSGVSLLRFTCKAVQGNQYDWQSQSYAELPAHQHRELRHITQELKNTELELEKVRFEIMDLLSQMNGEVA